MIFSLLLAREKIPLTSILIKVKPRLFPGIPVFWIRNRFSRRVSPHLFPSYPFIVASFFPYRVSRPAGLAPFRYKFDSRLGTRYKSLIVVHAIAASKSNEPINLSTTCLRRTLANLFIDQPARSCVESFINANPFRRFCAAKWSSATFDFPST